MLGICQSDLRNVINTTYQEGFLDWVASLDLEMQYESQSSNIKFLLLSKDIGGLIGWLKIRKIR